MLRGARRHLHHQRHHAGCRRRLAVRPGRVVALIGPNGAGKSTLAAHARRRARADARRRAARRPRARRTSRRPSWRGGAPSCRNRACCLPLHGARGRDAGRQRAGLRRPTPAQARTAALDALDAVGLRALAGRLYVHLSGGERQRVHIARALCQLAAARRPARRDPLLPARRAHLQPRPGAPVAGAGRRPAPGRARVRPSRRLPRSQPRRGPRRRDGPAGARPDLAAGPARRRPARRPAVGSLRLPGADQSHARRRPALRPAAGHLPAHAPAGIRANGTPRMQHPQP